MNILDYLQYGNPIEIGGTLVYIVLGLFVLFVVVFLCIMVILMFYFAALGFVSWFMAQWNKAKSFQVMNAGNGEYIIYSNRHSQAVLDAENNLLVFKSKAAAADYLKNVVLKYGIGRRE